MIFCIVALVLGQDDPAGGSLDQHLQAGRAARDQGHLVRAARELYAAARIARRDVRLALEAAQLMLTVGNDAQANELVRAAEQNMAKQRTWMQSLKSQLDAHIRERVQAGNGHRRAGTRAGRVRRRHRQGPRARRAVYPPCLGLEPARRSGRCARRAERCAAPRHVRSPAVHRGASAPVAVVRQPLPRVAARSVR